MRKYKFLNILDSLTEKEFKSLGKFMKSPFFNGSKNMIEFYELTKKYYHNHHFNSLSPELISKHIYKTEKFDNVKTRKLISDFSALLENFLIHNSVDKDMIGKKAYLSKQLSHKDLNKLYDIEIDDIKKLMNNSKWDSKSYYFSKLKLIVEELTDKIYLVTPDKQVEKIKNLTDSIDQLYIFIKLYVSHILIQNNFINESSITDYGFASIDSIVNYIEKNIEYYKKNEPRIFLYFLVLKLIKEHNIEKIYTEVEKYIVENRLFLSPEDIEFSIYTIVTYIVAEISRGKYEKIDLPVEVFKRIEANGFLEKIDNFNHFTYIQIINFASFLNDYEYTETFIWRYFPKISAYYKEDSLNLGLAILRYSQKRYEEAKEYLDKINFKTYGFYLLTNSLRLKIYYEENSLKYIPHLIDSFKHYIKRNKSVPQFYRESFSYFLNYLSKLTSLKKGNIKDAYKTEFILSNEKNFYGKKWIEEKLNELILKK